MTFGTASPTLAAMIGIGVGIDYAVFLTTRFRQQIIDGADPVEAAGFCTTTSGRAVLVAASTVAVAMLGLYASGIAFIGLLGLAAVFRRRHRRARGRHPGPGPARAGRPPHRPAQGQADPRRGDGLTAATAGTGTRR